jgi:rRNA maturation endonuclease Nob1
MRKRCSTCGTPAPDEASVFCNRCGSRLVDLLTCQKCGNRIFDRQSRFCDRCGFPLAPAVQVVPPPITLAKGKICPGCGFEIFVEDAAFCKKCGTRLSKTGSPGAVPDSRPPARSARTRRQVRDAMDRTG